eukprot:scaffold1409_cov245-Pinguiococcus_pyrenoidosus.AAC.3
MPHQERAPCQRRCQFQPKVRRELRRPNKRRLEPKKAEKDTRVVNSLTGAEGTAVEETGADAIVHAGLRGGAAAPLRPRQVVLQAVVVHVEILARLDERAVVAAQEHAGRRREALEDGHAQQRVAALEKLGRAVDVRVVPADLGNMASAKWRWRLRTLDAMSCAALAQVAARFMPPHFHPGRCTS